MFAGHTEAITETFATVADAEEWKRGMQRDHYHVTVVTLSRDYVAISTDRPEVLS